MRKTSALLLMLLFFSCFLLALLALRTPAASAVSVRAGNAERELLLAGGDGEGRTASELLPGEKLDLNSASVEELQKLPGIGPALAQAITDYRDAHGPFAAPEAVLQVPGIGPARYAAIADRITVEEAP